MGHAWSVHNGQCMTAGRSGSGKRGTERVGPTREGARAYREAHRLASFFIVMEYEYSDHYRRKIFSEHSIRALMKDWH